MVHKDNAECILADAYAELKFEYNQIKNRFNEQLTEHEKLREKLWEKQKKIDDLEGLVEHLRKMQAKNE